MKEKKVKPQFFTIFIPIYYMVIHFSVNQTTEQICAEDQIDGDDEETVSRVAACVTPGTIIPMEGMGTLLCVIKDYHDTAACRGVISHEAFHALTFLLKKIGASVDLDNDEFCTYIMQYIITEFYSNLKID